nr:mandelate racemase/muconate lactonizing enzyme family protein [Sedimentibacter sp.]
MNNMKIKDVKVRNIRIPLNDPKKFSTKYVTYRDYTIVNIMTEDGVEGWSFVWGLPVVKSIVDMVKDLLIGESAYATIHLWNKMFNALDRWDRSGIAMRAMSAIDIALWDIIGKYANLPIYKIMGGGREEVPAYYSGGYYPDSCESKNDLFNYLEKEMGTAYDRGFRMFKMKIGAADVDVDVERIGVVRNTIGPNCKLMVDANCGYDPETIISMARKFEKYDISWVEEPIAVDDLPNCAYVASKISMPVAIGENHFTRWAFREIIDHKAARIIQADPTVMGGFTEYLNLSGVAATYGIKLAPHCFHDINIQVALARTEVICLEYMDAESDVINVQKILENPVPAVNGMIKAPEGPGHGLILNEKAVEKYLYE